MKTIQPSNKIWQSKKGLPSFTFYTTEFIVGTLQMNTAQAGSYILLLCNQWIENGLPSDKQELAKIGRCDINTVESLLDKFPVCGDGLRRNMKLEEIGYEMIEFKKSKSKAGQIGMKKRWKK
jgi:uncharacterized protein YdaU (DUF1376 family)